MHPNDHVNFGQSSNDVIPTALHVSAVVQIERDLLPALARLWKVLDEKSRAFHDVIKTGRTHLMDATPIRLGQEFGGYASMVEHGIARLRGVLPDLCELALGGTAVGTGLNTHPEFGRRVAARIAKHSGLPFVEAKNHFEAQGSQDGALWASGAVLTVASSLMKIAGDIRLMNSGPRCGLAEVTLPSVQPGSSIMPGKVNPVICEALIQVGAQVTGNHAVVTLGVQGGQLDLNTMLPVIADNLLESVRLLAAASRVFADKAIAGLVANEETCRAYVEISLPAIQPGSSIMPGKVNPVVCEAVAMVSAQVMGNHVAITVGAQGGPLDLNVMLPMMAKNLLESIQLLAAASRVFADKAITGLVANAETCRGYIEISPSMATALNPLIGYDMAAEIAKRSFKERRPVRELAREMTKLSPAEIDAALDPARQTQPGLDLGGSGGGA